VQVVEGALLEELQKLVAQRELESYLRVEYANKVDYVPHTHTMVAYSVNNCWCCCFAEAGACQEAGSPSDEALDRRDYG
jgi:hypothetical protein